MNHPTTTHTNNIAILDYSTSLRIQPGHFKAMHNRAYCYEQIGRLEDAINDYTTALHLRPSHISSLNARAKLYELCSMMTEALNDLTAVIEIQDEAYTSGSGSVDVVVVASAYVSRARLLEIQNNHSDALGDLGRAKE